MRTLLLLRHAKSSWAAAGVADHDRALAPRGVQAGHRLAAHLRAAPASPELVLCSSAMRTRQTLDLLRPALADGVDVRVTRDLYGADPDDVLRLVRDADADISTVLVVGHNPTMEDLALDLAGDGDPAALERLRTKFPTGALATLDFAAGDWAHVGPGQGELTSFVVPRELPD